MVDIPKEKAQFALMAAIRLHVDRVQMRASNWVCIEGWIADMEIDALEVTSSIGYANCLRTNRPDVCQALRLPANLTTGFTLHCIFPNDKKTNTVSASLKHKGAAIATMQLELPAVNSLPLPFALPAAIELTQRLYRDTQTGNKIQESDRATRLDTGVLTTTQVPLPFDNTRIGNYHPDVVALLSQPGVVGLDIGCGMRDQVFENLVTQDIYSTPTATLITAPGDIHLPFGDETFDLIILDSVLEHVPDPIAMLQEGHRLLKPGGKIFGDAPFLQPLHLLPHHYFNFTPYGLEVSAKSAGLRLDYVAAESHQRPEFTLEWLLRRIFETVSVAESNRLKRMSVETLYSSLVNDKNLIALPDEAITEMAAGYRFHMVKPIGLGSEPYARRTE